MGFIKKRILGRLGPVARIADVVLVSNTVLRFARRKGWVSSETATKFGAPESSGGSAISIAEIVLATAAAFRLLGRVKKRKADG